MQILPALSCGFFSIAVLNINNIRDIESDRQAGKFSIPRANWPERRQFGTIGFCLLGGIVCALVFVILSYKSPLQFLFLLSTPLLIINGRSVAKLPSEKLDPFLKQMALSTLLFVLLFGVGNLLA